MSPKAPARRLAASPKQGRLESVVAATLSETIPVTVTTLADDVAIEALRNEINSEQRRFDLFALLVLAGGSSVNKSVLVPIVAAANVRRLPTRQQPLAEVAERVDVALISLPAST